MYKRKSTSSIKKITIVALCFTFAFSNAALAANNNGHNGGNQGYHGSLGRDAYEVWGFDQSHAHDDDDHGGHPGIERDGILYVWSGTDHDFLDGKATAMGLNWNEMLEEFYGEGNVPEDFGTPHMTLWNTGATHLVVGHTSGNSGVAIVDGDTRTVVDATTVGGNAHAAIPSNGNDFVLVSNISNQKVHKICVNYNGGKGSIFEDDSKCGGGTLDLAAAGVADMIGAGSAKAICPVVTASDAYSYVTLAAGGLAIVDNMTMTVAHTYTVDEGLDLVDANGDGIVEAGGEIGQNGCGGIEKDGIVYINSGTKNPESGDMVYAFNNAWLEATGEKPDFITVHQNGNDAHGMVVAGDYLWACSRGSNTCNVHANVSAEDLFKGVDEQGNPDGSYDPDMIAPSLASDPVRIFSVVDLQGDILGDAAPDLVDISPSGAVVFVAQRGPAAFTANSGTFHNAEGDHPGLGVILVTDGGKDGEPDAHYSVSRFNDEGEDVADVHAIRVRQ